MSPLRALDGRVLGPQGIQTRAVILAAVAEHLRVTPWHRASVSAVTMISGTSTATFYQYFEDLPAAVRELTGSADRKAPEHVRRVAELLAWEGRNLGAVGVS